MTARRVVLATAIALCAVVVAIALLPLVAESASAVSGDHVWTTESLVFFVVPVLGLAITVVLLVAARRVARAALSVVCSIAAVLIAAATCTPVSIVFWGLLVAQFQPPML